MSVSGSLTGRTIRIVAPARWAEPAALERFATLMRGHGAKVEIDRHNDARSGQLAGSDAERARALNAALADPHVDIVWCARGGYGAGRLHEMLTFATPNQKVLIGYSDITNLLLRCIGTKITPLHGAMPNEVREGAPTQNILDAAAACVRILSDEIDEAHFDLTPVQAGEGAGTLIPANLTVLTRLIGTPYEPAWERAILCVEDISEYYYAIDRLFLHLRQSRLGPRIAGIALGEFIDNQDNETPWGESVEQIAAAHFPDIPIAAGLPIGHGAKNIPLIVGRPGLLTVSASSALLTLPEHRF